MIRCASCSIFRAKVEPSSAISAGSHTIVADTAAGRFLKRGGDGLAGALVITILSAPWGRSESARSRWYAGRAEPAGARLWLLGAYVAANILWAILRPYLTRTIRGPA